MARQGPATEVEHADLLRRHLPALRYDSLEMFFADSAATWTDMPGNELRQVAREEPLATADGEGDRRLSLERLAAHAASPDALDTDCIACPNSDYRDRYHRLRDSHRDLYVGRVHCRAAMGADRRLWLQYWLWYVYNDYNLAGKIGLHEGDWELVQLQMKEDLSEPDLAIYSQHHQAELRDWSEVWRAGEEELAAQAAAGEEPPRGPDRSPTPLVYPARGSHANYYEPGEHSTDVWFDVCDGRLAPKKPLVPIFMDGPEGGWSRWRGRWGDTPVRPGRLQRLVDQPSPESPCMREHWGDPAALREKALARPPREPGKPGSERRAKAGAKPPAVSVSRRNGFLRIDYDFSELGERPHSIVVGVNSQDELRTSPRTYTFRVEWVERATLDTRIECAPDKRYDIHYSTVGESGAATMSSLCSIDVEHRRFDVKAIPRALNFIGRALDRVGNRLRRRRPGGPEA